MLLVQEYNLFGIKIMTENQNYKFDIYSKNTEIGIIELFPSALGGLDAINFTDTINSYSAQIKLLIIDLSKVEVMNSSGLGMLVNALSNLKKQNINLYLTNVPQKVMKLLQITHLDKVFKIYNDLETAVEDFK